MAVSRFLATSVICRHQSLSRSPPHQHFGSYFLVFRKCGVTPHRLYCDSLTLTPTYFFYLNYEIIKWEMPFQ